MARLPTPRFHPGATPSNQPPAPTPLPSLAIAHRHRTRVLSVHVPVCSPSAAAELVNRPCAPRQQASSAANLSRPRGRRLSVSLRSPLDYCIASSHAIHAASIRQGGLRTRSTTRPKIASTSPEARPRVATRQYHLYTSAIPSAHHAQIFLRQSTPD